jgi:hypothetical protein
MRWLFAPTLRPFVSLATGSSLVLNLALLMPSLFALQVFDRVFASRSVETLVMLSLQVLLALFVGYCMDQARSRALAAAGRALDSLLSPAALEQALCGAAVRPFGLAWYQGLVQTNAYGRAHQTFVGRFNEETFIVAPGAAPAPQVHHEAFPDAQLNPATGPIHTFHLGIWFNSPADAAKVPGRPDAVQRRAQRRHPGAEFAQLHRCARSAAESEALTGATMTRTTSLPTLIGLGLLSLCTAAARAEAITDRGQSTDRRRVRPAPPGCPCRAACARRARARID